MSALEELRALVAEREQVTASLESSRASTDRAREQVEKLVPKLARGGEKVRKTYRDAKASLEEATDVQRSWACELATLDGKIADLEGPAAAEQEQLDDASWRAGVDEVSRLLDAHNELEAKAREEIAKLEAQITASMKSVTDAFHAKVAPLNQPKRGPYHRPARFLESVAELSHIRRHGTPLAQPAPLYIEHYGARIPSDEAWLASNPLVASWAARNRAHEAAVRDTVVDRTNLSFTNAEMCELNYIIERGGPRAIRALRLPGDPCGRERWTFTDEEIRAFRLHKHEAFALIVEAPGREAPNFDPKHVAEQIRAKNESDARIQSLRGEREEREREERQQEGK